MRRLLAHLAFDDYIKLTLQFHFLVALGLSGSDTKAFAEYIQYQCNCSLFWRRNAYGSVPTSLTQVSPPT